MDHNHLNSRKEHFLTKLAKGEVLEFNNFVPSQQNQSDLEREHLKSWYQNITNLNFLVLNQEELEEIQIHSPTQIIYHFRKRMEKTDSDLTSEDLQTAYEILALKNGIAWNYTNPFASFETKINGIQLRITLGHFSLTPNKRSKCFIRILNSKPLQINRFDIRNQSDLIQQMVKQKKNILIAGSTGCGKTTFLNSLLDHVCPDEHLMVLEDVNEIAPPHLNTTKLLSEMGQDQKSLNSFMTYAMRMSPKRIVIGELRANEVESYLLAMNTGHSGLISTIHANSAKDALERVALLFKIYSAKDLSYELVLKLVTQNIDVVIYLENKKIKEIIHVFGSEKESIFYETI